MEKEKTTNNAKKRHTKLRHKVVYTLFKPLFALYFKLRYNYSCEKFKGSEDGMLVLSNHATTMDPFFVAISFKKPLFFVASDQLFNLGFASRLIEFLVAPIPKTKGVSDIKSVRDIKAYLDEGANVSLFPEGNRTFIGKTVTIPEQIGKLIKLLKKTVVLYNLKGGYLSKPRWAVKPRRGVMRGEIVKVLKYDDYKDMTPTEIYELVKEGLSVNAFDEQEKNNIGYKGNRRAEYIENVLYLCPKCKKLHTLKSKGNDFECESCGLKVHYTELGYLESQDEEMPFRTVLEWHDWQNKYIEESGMYGEMLEKPFKPFEMTLYKDERAKRRIKICDGVFKMYSDRVVIEKKGGGEIELLLENIVGMTPQTMGKMQMYTKEGDFVMTMAKNVSALSYVTLYYMNKNKAEGKSNEYLGQ